MYYHCRPLKYVEYGKVFPPPLEKVDEWGLKCYKWLSYYCGYCPQIWLSRSHQAITGFKQKHHRDNDAILFAFDIIQGFPVSYDPWEFLMNTLMNYKENSTLENINKEIQNDFLEMEKDFIKESQEYPEDNYELIGELKDWIACGRNLDAYLKKHVFVEVDQVVVPSLNLKVAKKIICREERQKKALRKMGFIEDRIQIKNIKTRKW